MRKLSFSWFCPSYGSGGNGQGELTVENVLNTASIAEKNGFGAILTPADSNCLDPWMLSAYILQHTKIIKPIIAIRTGFIEPVYTARMISTLSKLNRGRIEVNIVTGGSTIELAKEGCFLNHEERYVRSYEYMQIISNLLETGGPYSFEGTYYKVQNATMYPALNEGETPKVYIAGSSSMAKKIAKDFRATYLIWAEPVDVIREHLSYFDGMSNTRFCLRVNILVRKNRHEALDIAEKRFPRSDAKSLRLLKHINRHSDSVGQKRLSQLALSGDKHDTCLYSNSVLGKTGSVPTLIGSSQEVRESLIRYTELGITDFIISSIDNDHEIKCIGEEIIGYF